MVQKRFPHGGYSPTVKMFPHTCNVMGLLQLLSQLSKLSQYNFQWASPSHPPYRQRKGLGQGQRKRQKQKRRQRQKQRQRKRKRPRGE